MRYYYRIIVKIFFLFCVFGSVYASSEVSLDLTGYVDSCLNIERIDDNGTLNIFDRVESCFRVTSNINKNVMVTFKASNEWKLLPKDDTPAGETSELKNSIPYEGLFKRNNKSQIVNKDSNSVTLEESDFKNKEYEFSVIFRAKEKLVNLSAGRYYGRVTISVSPAN